MVNGEVKCRGKVMILEDLASTKMTQTFFDRLFNLVKFQAFI